MSVESQPFLCNCSRYPPAPAGARDVFDFLGETLESRETGWVCGRLFRARDEAGDLLMELRSGGASLSFRFASTDVRSELAAGDLAALRLRPSLSASEWTAVEARLLASGRRSGDAPLEASAGSSPERGRQWAAFIACVRSFFVNRGFLEARTPTLVPSPGTEPYLEAFETSLRAGPGLGSLARFLPTSPEFHLKRLLCLGWPRVFEIKHCFRNGEIGANHQPEFAMLEWYRPYQSLDAIAADADGLIAACCEALGAARPPPAARTTVRSLFERAHGFKLRPSTDEQELRGLCASLGQMAAADDAWDDLFFRAFLAQIEPSLGADRPTFVRDYPPRLAALARLTPEGWADRLEVYWKGLELANGFHELNDPEENRRRFASDRETRRRLGRDPFPEDLDLVKSLESGMPPAGGIALGLDRLFMAILDLPTIDETRPFPERAR